MSSIPSLPSEPREYGDRDLAALILRSAEPVVVESHFAGLDRPWRGLSAAAWRELLREFGERVNGALVETGGNREAAVRYGLEVIPVVLVFHRGEVVARFTGSVNVADVIGAVRAALERTRVLEAARSELEAVGSSRDVLSPVRSVLRRRANEAAEATVARAG